MSVIGDLLEAAAGCAVGAAIFLALMALPTSCVYGCSYVWHSAGEAAGR